MPCKPSPNLISHHLKVCQEPRHPFLPRSPILSSGRFSDPDLMTKKPKNKDYLEHEIRRRLYLQVVLLIQEKLMEQGYIDPDEKLEEIANKLEETRKMLEAQT
ncbi:conserved hypothetical protein [Ricinus communis]|uniref:Uncharacterized protein n=1 Tax=Ricinus communis TaxID=3988 RepID=B9S9L1_RICCO|nr:conserved hypothetical protein [Ricinus communis]